ncbi:LAGLIDADG family homing endonuclease [Candidatus Woesearchaeota archaeon]|nr:LAGLIDADG family homing endonuclease [Candidatus Woesearchaeota archaeon]
MKFDQNLAAIHGYLCSDGYVIKNPESQSHKYYYIGLRNTCLTLLEDFNGRCNKAFNVTPIIYRNERCKFQSKEVFYRLTKNDTYYSDKWSLPILSKKNLSLWLRAYFDCDGWVFVEERQNRHIGLDSINHNGLSQIQQALKRFQIESKVKRVKNGYMSRLLIYKKESLVNYQKHIGFLHPDKKEKLRQVIESYVDYTWHFPSQQNRLKEFVIALLKEKVKIKYNGIRKVNSILKSNLTNVSTALNELFGIDSKVYGPWINGYGTPYYELVVQKKDKIAKLNKILSLTKI